MNASDVIKALRLEPLDVEGGFYAETYRSPEVIPAPLLDERYASPRSMSTCIYYLLTAETFSRMHRLLSDEVFHFYLGDPVEMLLLYPDGSGATVALGPQLMDGQRPQMIIPRGVWQGCSVADGGQYALLGTTVAPGFDRADFELGDRTSLTLQYPLYTNAIRRLT